MANSYSQLTIHAVFAVKGRENIIAKHWRNELHEYISGIINHQNCKSFAVGGWKDHVHILFGLNPVLSISDFMRVVKANTSKWINEKSFVNGKFAWQEGYGAFSYAKSQRDVVIKYIINQEEHHKVKSFKEEYVEILNNFEVEFKNEYLFEFYD